MFEEATPNVQTAMAYLHAAIVLHEKHMTGAAPTTGPEGEKSQKEMMVMMEKAYKALSGKGSGRGGSGPMAMG